jgi:hypothetical protein
MSTQFKFKYPKKLGNPHPSKTRSTNSLQKPCFMLSTFLEDAPNNSQKLVKRSRKTSLELKTCGILSPTMANIALLDTEDTISSAKKISTALEGF